MKNLKKGLFAILVSALVIRDAGLVLVSLPAKSSWVKNMFSMENVSQESAAISLAFPPGTERTWKDV